MSAINTAPLTPAQRVALGALVAKGGLMAVTLELDNGDEALAQSAAALTCLQQCVQAGYAKHSHVADATGLFEITSLGRFRYELDRAPPDHAGEKGE